MSLYEATHVFVYDKGLSLSECMYRMSVIFSYLFIMLNSSCSLLSSM